MKAKRHTQLTATLHTTTSVLLFHSKAALNDAKLRQLLHVLQLADMWNVAELEAIFTSDIIFKACHKCSIT